ncbi:MAG: Acryloyl-CoA reductase (NADH) [Alphaproteobacteria bacterium MarineAlpha11_Bin1]|nr:MAG: Acryloyl-CoA reductase (NADH) [Alphaproteobacteria bacterium MarineAlpha11_Bin1]|tara:strand:- start:2915 stop:4072 length:1158 start_codon:yes stop_codon:yes gene_type:complete
MDFQLPEELRMLQETVRRFVDRELIPIEQDSMDGPKLKTEVQGSLEEKAKAIGLWLFDVPEEYGGQGLGLLARSIVWTELARTIALPTRNVNIFGPIVSPILYYLNETQKEKYLFPVLEGKLRHCFAQTEPEAGGDPGGMRTTAVRDGNHYVINGMKRFITGAGEADFAQVIAATDREKGSRGGISAFLVDMDSPGVKLIRAQETMMNDRPWEIAFEDVRVPPENMIGEEGDGFKFAQNWISAGRIRHGARGIGVIERCLELGASYAKQRETFGKKLAERQSVQWMLVDSYADLHMLRLMVHTAAAKHDAGEDIRYDAYMCKYLGDTKSFEAADRCMQIHGGMGLTTDLPIERMWRDQRSFIITEGPTEILKMALARHVLRQYGD